LPELLDDFIAGKLKPLYRAPTIRNPGLIPVPDRSRFNMPRGNTAFVQATRGCGNACRFCYLGSVSWGPFRARPVRQVLDELAAMRERIILSWTTTCSRDRDHGLELFAGMPAAGQTLVGAGSDDAGRRWRAASGPRLTPDAFRSATDFRRSNAPPSPATTSLTIGWRLRSRSCANRKKRGILVDGTSFRVRWR